MKSNTKFDGITIVEHGLILKCGKNEEREISFSELDKIYIKVDKLRPICELGFILLPFLVVFLSVQFLELEKVMFIGLSAIIPVFVKINNYKSYGLRLCLKDGTIYRKRIPVNLKSDNVSMVSSIRKKMWDHYPKVQA